MTLRPSDIRLTPQLAVSVASLIVANLIPLWGVLYFEWSLGSIMFLYWLESAVIGVYNVVKLTVVGGWTSMFYIPFFIFHYGMFMFVHFVFISALFLRGMYTEGALGFSSVIGNAFSSREVLYAATGLAVSHGVSFALNFLGNEEYRHVTVAAQMHVPYRRIVVMHLTIIGGGFLLLIFGAPTGALAIMIVVKIATDITTHLKEHRHPMLAS
jgi:hypothetical protein